MCATTVLNGPKSGNKDKKSPVRRTLSCLPCRHRKLKCSRNVPCTTCSRYGREEECLLHPPPSLAIDLKPRRPGKRAIPRRETGPHYPALTSLPASESRTRVALTGNLSSAENGPVILSPQSTSFSSHSTVASSTSPRDTLDLPADAVLQPSAYTLASLGTSRRKHNAHDFQIWRQYLVSQVPTRFQCDILIAYYFEHIGWFFQSIHQPSFRNEYYSYWRNSNDTVDVLWLSLLYILLAVAGLLVPGQMNHVLNIGTGKVDLRERARHWFQLSRQALQAGGYEVRPQFVQLQTFVITQLYLYCTEEIELLNSYLGQAVRHAQALRLDKPGSGEYGLSEEIRRRVWWDICSADISQSFSLDRQPLIMSYLSKTPIPATYSERDPATADREPELLDPPTLMGMHIIRTRLLRVVNELYRDDAAHIESYAHISNINNQMLEIMESRPWYLRLDREQNCLNLPAESECIHWQHHVLQTFMSLQRIRMYRPFLRKKVGDSWSICLEAAETAFAVYMSIRRKTESFHKSPKYRAQVFQIFNAAVPIAMLLLIERPTRCAKIRQDLEIVVSDLELLEMDTVYVVLEGRVILRQILTMYDQASLGEKPKALELVQAIHFVFGGEEAVQKYLENRPEHQTNPENAQLHLNQPTSFPESPQSTYYLDIPQPLHMLDSTMQNGGVDYSCDIPFGLLDWDGWDEMTIDQALGVPMFS